jgi:FkbM family methyltransferase
MTAFTRTARRLLSAVPAKRAVLRAAGRLPPGLRTQASYRLFSALSRETPAAEATAPTNMGISSGLRCEVPTAHTIARFGSPALYVGERGALELTRHLTRRSSAFVDVGAHTGIFTFHVRSSVPPEIPVYFFEPDPVLFEALAHNVDENRLPNVHGFNEAIGAIDGLGTFYVNGVDSLSGSLLSQFGDQHDMRPIDMPVATFASVTRRLNLSRACAKVDVEGAERAFLDGAGDALRHVSYLVMEVLGPAAESGFIADLMSRGGFQAYYIDDYQLEPSREGSFHYHAPEYNWLFCRETPNALAAIVASSHMRVRQ